LLISADRVIVSPGAPPVRQGSILVTDEGKVGAVDTTATLLARFPRVDRLDFPGATALPGLINAHVHLAFDASSDPAAALKAGDPEILRVVAARHARELLDAGVTTVRDLGDRDRLVSRLRDDIAAGSAVGPRILSSLAPLTSPGGHCWFLGGEVGDDTAIRRMIADHAAAGADLIKVMAGGGRMTPSAAPVWESQFTRHQLDVVVSAAKEVGLPVAAHAHGTETMAICARSGVDTIEHGSWLSGPTAEPRCYDASEEVAALIADAGIYVCPTRSRNWRNWPESAGLDDLLGRLAWMRERGIRIMAGTDAGVGSGLFDDFVESLGIYEAAGWPTSDVLGMATTSAAAAVGRPDQIGRLSPGFEADVLVVAGDPLADLRALHAVQCVLVAGRTHYPTANGPQRT
jgi:imidazolonepropionase-like amidohydrolase